MKIGKSINSAKGYWADDLNAESNKKILQALRDAMYELYDGQTIGNVDLVVYNIQKGVSNYVYYFKIEFVDLDNPNDSVYLYVACDEQSKGKFKCYLTEYTISEPLDRNTGAIESFIIRMSGSKEALSHEIKRIAGGIFNNDSQGVESSMNIRRNRVTANKRRAVKAASSDMRTQFQSFLNKVDREVSNALYQYGDAVWTVKGTMSNDENGYWFELNLWCDREEAGTVNIEVDISSNYRTSTDEYVVSVPDSNQIQAEGNSFDDILDTCVGELIRLAEDYENFVRIEY